MLNASEGNFKCTTNVMPFVFPKNHTTIKRYFDTLRQILTAANRKSEDLPTDNFFLRVFFKYIIEQLNTQLFLSRS